MTDDVHRAEGTAARRRVLVTGAAGRIGSSFAAHTAERYDLRLMVARTDEGEALHGFGEVVAADLTDLERIKEVCEGVDTVVHLAANPSPSATWNELLRDNVVGTYHLMAAAKSAGCRRVVYASSIHAVSGYPADVQVKTSEPVNPGDLYGVSKCFGEALGRYLAEQEGLSVLAVRIGSFKPLEAAREEEGVKLLTTFVSERDLCQLLTRAVDVEGVRFAVLHGLSDNRFKRLDLTDTRALVGYEPQDDLSEENPRLRGLELDEATRPHDHKHGGQPSGLREELGES